MKMKQKGLPPWNDNEKKRKRKAVALPASYLHVSEAQLLHGTLGRGGGRNLSISFAQEDPRPNLSESPVRIVLSNLLPYSGFLLVRQGSRRGSANEVPKI